MTRYRIGSVDDCLPGEVKCISTEKREFALCNLDGIFYVVEGICPHAGGLLSKGDLEGENLICPLHEWQFNITSGVCLNNPHVKIKTFEVEVDGENIFVIFDE